MGISLVSFYYYVLFQLTEPKHITIVSIWVPAKFCSSQKKGRHTQELLRTTALCDT
jgi:hypothetical protein